MMVRRVRQETTACGHPGRFVDQWPRTSMCVRNSRHREPTVTRPHGTLGGGRPVQRPSGELTVGTQHDGDAVIVVIAGEFDLATAGPVREALSSAISESRQRVIVDLGGVTFIDSSGLHTIVNACKLCRDGVPALTIRPGPPNVQQVFEFTDLLDQLPFESTG